MENFESKLFDSYKHKITDARITKCKANKLKPKQELLGPISFWHLGSNFSDKSLPTLAFVGKTTWMDSEDYSKLPKIGPIYDGRKEINYFFGPDIWRYKYWLTIKKICQEIYSKENNDLSFLDNVFITNLVKCNVNKKGVDSKNITGYDYFSNCIDIFEKEIEIVKPSHIIFFTNSQYDDLISNLSFGFEKNRHQDFSTKEHRKEITQRNLKNKDVCWWHRRFYEIGKLEMNFLRTRHPQGAPKELANEIINWVNSTK